MGVAERKEREKQQRRNDIIDAAEKVFFSKGYENSSMDDVAKQAELSKGTLYLYFHSKEDLYAAIVGRGASIMNKLFSEAVNDQPNGLCKTKSIGQAFIKFFNEYPDYHDALMFDQSRLAELDCDCMNEIAALEIKKKSNEIFIGAIKEGIEDGSIRNDLDPVQTAMILWGQTMGVLQLVKNKGIILNKIFKVDSQAIIDEHFNLAYKMLSP